MEYNYSFRGPDGRDYRLDLSGQLSDKADRLSFETTVSILQDGAETAHYRASVTVSEQDGVGTVIDLRINDSAIRIPISDLVAIESEIEAGLDFLTSLLPADPVTRCAVKAGVGAVTNQLVSCYRAIGRRENVIGQLYGCMLENGTNIGWKFVGRFGRCMVRGAL